MVTNARKSAAKILLAMGLSLAGPGLHAQESRKVLNNPTPTYPETARRFRLSGGVKVQVLVAPDGQIKDVKVVGGMRFRGIHVNPVVARERHSIEPGAVGEQGVVAKKGYRGFEVQAAGHRDGDNFVAVGLDDLRELADAFRVAAFGESHKKLAADAKNVPAFERSGKLDVGEFAVLRKLLREQVGFAAAALRA